ncbi:MAG: ABC-type Mn/Zn transport system, periplasmic Mn/Zn-binding protein [Candidatus Phytoplasma australasiaticum]|uniref:ABC-type Mn/Zn transport system, periplasmic Mn/Zn-binding protein n=2 Tax=Candidatus Phytoplasma TaxID=33926 RepID=A0ABN0J7T6_PEWBP|nr:ABC-type Mn/Zn transport system, periplasmic Mn/Zn-binding protein [Peanut witches'-broom phytoplasma NTU2011]QLL37079.1 ABC-type Mn/Zn transport system, periplasmic Mn/Zn-binding protein ['Echinacea purpurea' witches'-broom phytoplasma]WEX20624.1 MAG: ABC-type Mn/Zn transport system periplasmic Mn/Zn-binding protein [Candidatus Phytoplasma aurantifolia]WKV64332.1 MAG: ABC-type Mn/Zn transport system, periplasmic Mn/Zn-binding protein [Candidatus Phytoplasma australasiaticum]WMW50384.1 MAG: 
MINFLPNKNRNWFIFMLFFTIINIYIIFYAMSVYPRNNIDEKIIITSTTNLLNDLVNHLIGNVDKKENPKNKKYQKINNIKNYVLMGPGVDPHNYKMKQSDRIAIKKANLIITNGLHLESKMTDSFSLIAPNSNIWSASQAIKNDQLIIDEKTGQKDPHIWFSIDLWQQVLKNLKEQLQSKLSKSQDLESLENNFNLYQEQLNYLKQYTKKIFENRKIILITAHDAFSYLAKENQFKGLYSIQGISTQTETSPRDIEKIAQIITKYQVKAIFIESSVPHNYLDSLIEAVNNYKPNFKIKISDQELYSDSLGTEEDPNYKQLPDTNQYFKMSSYIGTFLHNIDIISQELK